jgi:hypothetical protein
LGWEGFEEGGEALGCFGPIASFLDEGSSGGTQLLAEVGVVEEAVKMIGKIHTAGEGHSPAGTSDALESDFAFAIGHDGFVVGPCLHHHEGKRFDKAGMDKDGATGGGILDALI